MSTRFLQDDEKDRFDLMIEDLRTIFKYEQIKVEDIQNVITTLRSDEVREYIDNLSRGSKPESALREAFFAGRSLLSRFFGGTPAPEVNLGNGYVDYTLRVNGRFILIELKSLFEPVYEPGKTRRIKSLNQKELRYDQYKEQVLKYLQEGSEYIILTDLKDWYFFNRLANPANFNFFAKFDLHTLINDYSVIGDFWDFVRRQDEQAIREDLDKKFFESLKIWVSMLSEVEFETDDQTKVEHIIRLLNKFIFIQTLDDFYVIDSRWIKTNWDEMERKWKVKGKLQVLTKYFKDLDEWFNLYYDTELFRENVLTYIKKDEQNIEKLYNNLQLVLGVTGWQTTFRGVAGIMQYNFRFIDEDIFGKAYETFLAEVRHDEGIYYTPKYITRYIAETTVGMTFSNLLTQIEKALEKGDFTEAHTLIKKFTSIRILDPACGSGSFLIKTIRIIMEYYRNLKKKLDELYEEQNKFNGTLVRSKEVEEKSRQIQSLLETFQLTNERDLISRLLVRHIHGNDLDQKALEVAKVNIWLAAIKLAPHEFRFDKLPSDTNHILPNLEMNLVNGNSVVGLPTDDVIEFMITEYKEELEELSKLRSNYISNPTHQELVEKIVEIKQTIRKGLDERFEEYIEEKGISEEIIRDTKPFYWPLELWYFYFDGTEPLNEESRGADVVLGNPPYERIQVLKDKSPAFVDYLSKADFKAATGNYDLAVIFIEKGYDLLKNAGNFGYIVTNKFMTGDYGIGLRTYLTENKAVSQIVDFGDQQVFDNATTYTALIFLEKTEMNELKYALVRKLEKTLVQLQEIRNNSNIENNKIVVTTQKIGSLGVNSWVLIKSDEESIIENFNSLNQLGDVSRIFVGLQTSADPVYIFKIVEDMNNLVKTHSKSLKKDFVLEKTLLKPLLMGKDIKRWIVPEHSKYLLFPYNLLANTVELVKLNDIKDSIPKTWGYLVKNKEKLEGREKGTWKDREDWYGYVYLKNMDKFNNKKIITQVLANKATFALDTHGKYYFPGGGNAGGYGILINDDCEISLEYVCALLNSSLLDWNLKKNSTRFRGGFYSYAKRYIEKLPIKIPETKDEKEQASQIEETVARILEMKTKRHTRIGLWKDVSRRLSNSNRSLFDILKTDEHYQREGTFDSSWTSKASFYPSAKIDTLNAGYNDFSLFYDAEKSTIKIFGLSDDGIEEQIFEMTFRNTELLSHVYNCLETTLESRLRVKTLKQLLDKTDVPIIQPNFAKNTMNILKKIVEEAENIEYSIGEIDNIIMDCEAHIDSIVFNLYGLNIREVNIVMNSLNQPPSYQQRVLSYST